MKDYYEILGVPRDATTAAIKKAYRKKAAAAHPERAGGSHDAMADLNEANDCLGNPERRAAYDALGEDFGADADARAAEDVIAVLAVEAMEMGAANVIEMVAGKLRAERRQLSANLYSKKNAVTKRERWLGRVQRKGEGEGENVIEKVFAAKLLEARQDAASAEFALKINQYALDALNDYTDVGDLESVLRDGDRLLAGMQQQRRIA